jgi:hypothetical protein
MMDGVEKGDCASLHCALKSTIPQPTRELITNAKQQGNG